MLHEVGFENLNWRKGTGLNASPPDRGRDIECKNERDEPDGHKHRERWFAQCKHHKTGVPPEKLQGVLTWAMAERPDVVLVTASNFLSNAAKDYLSQYQAANKPPFRVKVWEKPDLERLTANKARLLRKYAVSSDPPHLSILHVAHVLYLCVVVKYAANDAFVLTAYLTDKPKKGEQLWPTK